MSTAAIKLVLGCFLACGTVAFVAKGNGSAHKLNARIHPRYGAAPLVFDKLSWTNGEGQRISITRLDFLVSDFAFRKTDGTWLEVSNSAAFVSLGGGRDAFTLDDAPSGKFDRVRFHVGLTAALNHSDPAQYPADHPLNPNLNGMHWGWVGGYIFLALEGRWQTDDGRLSGYSFHLGNDAQLMTVELPATLNTGREQILELSVDVAGLFAGRLAEEATSTHSRAGDALASTLRANVEKAFSVQDVDGHIAASGLVQGRGERRVAVATARDAHPYRFTLSSNFPIPDLPRDNPLTEEGVELGRRLFSERLLSVNDSQSCASCHQANAGFSDAGKAVSVGAEGREGTRNAMPIFNLAWKNSFFWDGRAATLREQVLMPVQNPVEMHANLGQVVGKLNQAKDYPALFEKAFGARAINAELIARALEQFALTQISCDSKFDRAMAGTEKLSDEEQRGFELFFTEYDPRIGMHGADCFHCHGGPFFTTHGFANNGLDSQFTDLGRYAVTTNDWDRGKFAVPSLRNVELTGPYMHDGRFKTLEEVVDHYCTGMKRSGSLDPNLAKHPDGGVPLSADEKKALVAFLKTLTDESLKPVARTEVAQNDTR